MCGRYQIDKEIAEMNGIIRQINEQYETLKLGEVFPTNLVPVLMMEHEQITPQPVRWSFPHWKNKRDSIINARSETALERPMFRKPLQTRRCVIPSTGFYEWAHVDGKAKKDNFLLRRPGEDMLYMAGMVNSFRSENGAYDAFVILTTAANESVAPIHDRMPIILDAGEQAAWLQGDILADVLRRPGPELTLTNTTEQQQLTDF